MLHTARVYRPRGDDDGTRMLVMRLWPRGIRREHVDEWNRDLAPSRELLFAYKRGGLTWSGFVRRFRTEIRPEAIDALRRRAKKETITILCACEDESRCHRGLLKALVARKKTSTQRRKATKR